MGTAERPTLQDVQSPHPGAQFHVERQVFNKSTSHIILGGLKYSDQNDIGG